MRVFYSRFYNADIGSNHTFPIRKFEFGRDRLLNEGTLVVEDILEPNPVELVLGECYGCEIPVVTVMSDGYGEKISDTVEIHCNTIRAVRSIYEPLGHLIGHPFYAETG